MLISFLIEEILLCTLLFVIWISESVQNLCTDLKHFNNLNTTYKPSGPRIKNSVAYGLLHCVGKCKEFRGCTLFAFNLEEQTCALYSGYEYSNTGLTTLDRNIVTSAIKDWQSTPDRTEIERTRMRRGFYCFVRNETFYKGKVNLTKDGLPCQRWDSHAYQEHHLNGDRNEHFSNTGETLADVANYCRLPTSSADKIPWCYTATHLKRWEYCNVTEC